MPLSHLKHPMRKRAIDGKGRCNAPAKSYQGESGLGYGNAPRSHGRIFSLPYPQIHRRFTSSTGPWIEVVNYRGRKCRRPQYLRMLKSLCHGEWVPHSYLAAHTKNSRNSLDPFAQDSARCAGIPRISMSRGTLFLIRDILPHVVRTPHPCPRRFRDQDAQEKGNIYMSELHQELEGRKAVLRNELRDALRLRDAAADVKLAETEAKANAEGRF